MQKFSFILLTILLFFLISCTQDMTVVEKGKPSASKKVLFAASESAFKKDLIDKTFEKLEAQDFYFKVIGLSQLDSTDISQFGAVVLVPAFMAGKIDDKVMSYLSKHPNDKKIIVYYTRGTDAPLPDASKPDLKVDSLSSASKMDSVAAKSGELADLIKKRF